MTRRRAVLAACVLALAAVMVAAAALGASGKHPRSGFTIKGRIGGLYPGVHRRLVIVVRNRGKRPILIRSVTTRVRRARTGCPGRYVHVARYRGRVRVRGHASRRIRVRIWLLPGTPSACQGAVFRLVFRGRASGA
jgi:hypothetical protein